MSKGKKNLVEIKEEVKVDEWGAVAPQPEEEKEVFITPPETTITEKTLEIPPEPETISIPKTEWEQVQKTLEMLKSVADKGRVYNYESQQKTDKKPKRVKLAKYDGGYIIAWETQKDELVKHPVTGATIGENQQIQVKILMPNGDINSKDFSSYVSFSNARYDEKIECEVIGTAEDYNGKITWTLALPDGRSLQISPAFVN